MFSQIVSTAEGPVNGFVDEKHQAMTWLGIPYAAPAKGKLRWHAPQPALKHTDVLECTSPAPMNIQLSGGEEGVLTLDIYRPVATTEKLPVMVFFHGGNNQTHSSLLWEGGLFVQNTGAIFISVQSRLGPLGFNCLPALKLGQDKYEDSGNYGLLDLGAALDWIKNNITAFGGDSENITVSGFSSGGRNIMAMLLSPYFKGKFQKAISFSGGLTVADERASQLVFAEKLAPLVVEDGLKADLQEAKQWLLQPLAEVRDYLYSVKAERLAPLMAGALIRMSAFPHLYGDGNLLPRKGFKEAPAFSVPLLLFASADEFTIYCIRDKYFKDRLAAVMDEGSPTSREYDFANSHCSQLHGYFNAQESAVTLYPRYNAPIYVGHISYGHNPEVVGRKYALSKGAFHGSFLSLVNDGSVVIVDTEGNYQRPGALELRKKFFAALGAFIRNGTPQAAELGKEWPLWNPADMPELVFDADAEQALISTRSCSFNYADFYREIDEDTSISAESKAYILNQLFNGRWFSTELDRHYGNKSLWPQE